MYWQKSPLLLLFRFSYSSHAFRLLRREVNHELCPYQQNRKLVEWAKAKDIHITSYMTLVYGNALKDETIIRIAQKHHNATPAQFIHS